MIEPKEVLSQVFGYQEFRPNQENIVNNLINNKSVLAVLSTGQGKSITFQIPALCLKGMTVVISPLIALMNDQVQALQAKQVNARSFSSSLLVQEKRDLLKNISEQKVKILYIAPESLENSDLLNSLFMVDISLIAIDEAHCISSWGHSFRPKYRLIPKFIQNHAQGATVAAFTATANAKVRQDIVKNLGLQDCHIEIGNLDRPSITHKAKTIKKEGVLIKELRLELLKHKKGAKIIYCKSRKQTEMLCSALRASLVGQYVSAYHAGLGDKNRREIEEKFVKFDDSVIFATIALGMGIDKSNVRLVLNVGLPNTLEAYTQQVGRASRDGLPSDAITYLMPRDEATFFYFLKLSKAPKEVKDLEVKSFRLMKELISPCNSSEDIRKGLVDYFI